MSMIEGPNPGVIIMSNKIEVDVFEYLPSPALLLDKAGIILGVNDEFIRVFGLSRENVLGIYFLDWLALDAETRDTLKKKHEAYLKTGGLMNYMTYLPAVTGKGFWAVINSRVFRQGNRTYCIQIYQDISEPKKIIDEAKNASERVKQFFSNVKDLVQAIDPDGKILYANQVCLHTLGYAESDLPGLNLLDIARNDQVGHCLAILERVKQGEEFEFVDTVFRTRDGRDVMVEGNIRGQFENGRFLSAVCVFRDVTYKRSLEETYTS
jgi:PAS domain S-box-containing protein